VNPQGSSAESVHAKAGPASAGPGERARLSAAAGSLLDRRGDVCRREEPSRYESGLRAHGSNQRFHRLLGHAVARALTTAPSLTDLSPAAARILISQGWRRKGPPGSLSRNSRTFRTTNANWTHSSPTGDVPGAIPLARQASAIQSGAAASVSAITRSSSPIRSGTEVFPHRSRLPTTVPTASPSPSLSTAAVALGGADAGAPRAIVKLAMPGF
jgi:hypothetical protein